MKMFLRVSTLFIFLIVIIFAKNDLFKPSIRRYFIQKDYFTGFKLGEFSIFDSSKKDLLFRIESLYTFGGKIQIINNSSKQVVAELRNKLSFTVHKANFTILDPVSKQWINGKFERQFHFFNRKYLLQWNQQNIRIENKFSSYTTTFKHDKRNQTLAKAERYTYSLIKPTRYDLEIYSDDIPDIIYILGVFVIDLSRKNTGKG
ncbi:hypothetical protein I4U23_017352 [Adineta vaga]|nr:hypothetical protein I4U23_017352 [Adineta vaga]